MSNPIQYTSRTFTTILNDINNDAELVDKPEWWKRVWAGIGDVFSVWLNAQANQSYLSTAFTRFAVTELARLIDYEAEPQSTSSGVLLYYLDGATTFPKSLSSADLVALSQGSISVASRRFEARASVNAPAVNEVVTADDTNDWIVVTRVYTTGEKVRFTTGGTLPSPLQINTDYYAIYVSDTQIRLATSLANAYAGTYIDLTDTGTGTHTIHLFSVQVTSYQQESRASFVAGVSDGSSEWQELDLPDVNILEDTITVIINALTWTKVDTFIDSGPTDTHYRLLYKTDNTAFLQFGDGTYGAIPGAFDIEVSYAFGGGQNSNITTVNKITIYAGNDSDVTGVSNPGSFTGGAERETMESIKRLAPLLLKARDRFVTTDDGIALAIAYGGISLATVIKNEFGLLSCGVYCIANGGGNPTGAVQSALQTYLIDRTVLESIDVRVLDSTITSYNVTSAAKVLPGYVYADIEPFFELGWILLLSEVGQELKDLYDSEGIDSAREFINSTWTYSFTDSDNANLIPLLENFTPRDFADTIQESDAFALIDGFVVGVDYVTITAPAFPITLGDSEITTNGTLTLTEIP